MMNIAMILQMAAEALGERPAISVGRQQLTYRQLYCAACNAAQQFREVQCDSVALLDEGGLVAPVALFGAAIAGKPYVPLNYRLSESEIEALLTRVAPVFLLAGETRAQRLGKVPGVISQSCQSFIGSVTESSDTGEPDGEDSSDIAVQLFTSGTTGQPKAALLRHHHLLAYILGTVDFAAAQPEEAVLVSVPPYHIAGISTLLSSTYAGRRIVLLPSFDPQGWLDLAERERVSNAFVVPTMLARIVELLQGRGVRRAELPGLRALAYGGGKMPLSVIEAALELFPNVDFTNAYGLTETSSTITLLGPEDHRKAQSSEDPAQRRRLTSVGRPLPGIELEIRDSAGRVLGPGQVGEIHVRGEQVAGEYAEKGSLLDDAGWFPTRDAGFLDAQGYLFLEGRADDVIVRGGENISPGEIEHILEEHEAVADAAAVGVPSEQWGEAVAAAVVLRPGHQVDAAELQSRVRERLRSSRVPERIVFVEALPYNEMGKLLRRRVREQLATQG